jgi:predicted MFS family arabinose efflux permease
MANVWKRLPVAAKSALIAASVSVGILVGTVVGECLSERGVCSFNDPTLWLYGAVAFFGGWLVLATAMWALERDRRKEQQ